MTENEVAIMIENETKYDGNVPSRATKVAAVDYYAATYIDPYRDNYVYGMGAGTYNQLGALGASTYYPSLVLGRSCKDITMGYYNGMAITNNGELWVWGLNTNGKNGTGNTTTVASPRQVGLPGGIKVKKVQTGRNNTLALGEDNQLYVTGSNTYGILGNGKRSGQALTFTKIDFFNGMEIVDMDVNIYGAIAVASNGNVYVWGYNYTTYRVLGLPTNTGYVLTPVLLNPHFTLASGEKVVKVSMDDLSTLGGGFITDQGRFFAFSNISNYGGGSGYQAPTNLTPSTLQTGERFTKFSMNNGVGLITNQNRIYGAGLNYGSRFGTGNANTLSTLTNITPANLADLQYSGISLGYNNMYLTLSNKRFVLYGAGSSKQLGKLNEGGKTTLSVVFEK
ncbi:hypothetical protein IQ37_19070 [Chryseobacterium piperi]|uniref:RCC1 repeat-containing protein n=1 Tax=Chryseobacterium piperi TaxID=558152 RepID=A0A086AAK4_9FLAO|nr:hypothetical protein [Chryseobacterium piperi]ASW75278.1 hypothetical protein CJF12_13940 [Chryseobacterium piperi]KFF13718.1 hypothetical protein IQ37_19070 [Chryseobacterium piperi]